MARGRGACDRLAAAEPLKGQRVRALPGSREAARAAADDGNGGSQRGRGQGCRSVAGPGSCGTDRERDARRAIDRQPRSARQRSARSPSRTRRWASSSRRARAVQRWRLARYAVATRSVPARLTRPSAWRESPSPALRRSSASVPSRALRVAAREMQRAVRGNGSGRVDERAVEHSGAAQRLAAGEAEDASASVEAQRRARSRWRSPVASSSGADSASTGPLPPSIATSSAAPARRPMWRSAGAAGSWSATSAPASTSIVPPAQVECSVGRAARPIRPGRASRRGRRSARPAPWRRPISLPATTCTSEVSSSTPRRRASSSSRPA